MLLCLIRAHHLRKVLAHRPMARLLWQDQHHQRHEKEELPLQNRHPRGDIFPDMPQAGLLQDLFRTGLSRSVWLPNHQMKKFSHAFRGITTLWQISGHFCSCDMGSGTRVRRICLALLQTDVVYSNDFDFAFEQFLWLTEFWLSSPRTIEGWFSKFTGVDHTQYTWGKIFQKEWVCGSLFDLLWIVVKVVLQFHVHCTCSLLCAYP